MSWEDLEIQNNKPQEIGEIEKITLRTFGSEHGEKFIKYLEKNYLEKPVAIPGATPDHAFFREGQNSVVRDIFLKIKKARKL